MKKIALTVLCSISLFVKAQTTLNTLSSYTRTQLANVTEEVISQDGWELTESKNVDSIITLTFNDAKSTLVINRYKNYDNEVHFICDKSEYEILNKSILALKPKLISSTVNKKGNIVKNYIGEKYSYEVTIAPKGVFAIAVFSRSNYFAKPTDTLEEDNVEPSGFGETPIALRKFTNLVLPEDNGLRTGKIAVRIKINKAGLVIDATPGVKGTTLNDRELWQKCKEAITGARLAPSETAPDIQIGVIVFNFKVK